MATHTSTRAYVDPDEMVVCPICKSSRYLNPDLSFVINDECYHKMCTSCVDRLFTSGPAPCPVAGCHKTLRKRGFHPPTFADLTIEREVSIRRRVSLIFNRQESDFETLLDWNNYLETVESLIFSLVDGSPAEKKVAERKLQKYKEENEREIKEGVEREREEREEGVRLVRGEEVEREREREGWVREMEEERMEKQLEREGALERLATGRGDASEITRASQRPDGRKRAGGGISSDRSGRNGVLVSSSSKQQSTTPGDPSDLTIRGLKKKVVPVAEKPYDPFGGLDLTPRSFVLQDEYENDWLRNAKKDQRHVAGGYSLKEYYGRTLFDAFSGLGVFVAEELEVDGGSVRGVERGVGAMEVDDVF